MFASKDTLLTRPSGGYNIARSVRTRSSASGYFSRTPASATNRQIWTWSGWVKRGTLGAYQPLFVAGVTGGQQVSSLAFSSAGGIYDKLELNSGVQAVSVEFWIQTNAVYRDPSAWYHVVASVDTTQATASNRVKLYINGSQITATSAYASYSQYPSQNYNTPVNNTVQHLIARDIINTAGYLDGYLTEINFVDGQALTPSSFGETDSITGVWKPKAYSGTYGTNGFELNFSDNSTSAALGTDFSGNGNNWTPNNISVTAGVTYDSMQDVPTLTSATAANYCVVNPLDKGGGVTITDGNLTLTRASSVLDWDTARCTIQVPSTGKYYWELTLVSGSNDGCLVGVGTATADLSQEVNGFWAYQSAGYIIYNGSYTTATALSVGDVVMVAFDRTSNKLWFGRNGTWGLNGGTPVTPTDPNSNFTSLPSDLFPAVGIRYTANSAVNFGQRPFSYTPPTGFVALNTYNLPASTITNGAAYMAATTYTGNADFNSITNSGGFQPDFVWVKERSEVRDNILVDSVRGVSKALYSNLTSAEGSTSNFTEFLSNGFKVGYSGVDADKSNKLNQTYVGWQWKAGGTSASNTNGTITSTVSAGATQGFSVVTYTGTGANATVGHGLGVAPSMIIVKCRSNASTNWTVYHTSLGNTGYIYLNLTNAAGTGYSGFWNSTSPTSSVFSLGSDVDGYVNGSGRTNVAYCVASVAGFSSVGSYTGNGSTDGPFIYLGFKPRWFMSKRSDTAGNDWVIMDTSRDTYNASQKQLYADLNIAEEVNSLYDRDFLSNGIKIRTSTASANASGGTYIYMAFAENPFRNALAR